MSTRSIPPPSDREIEQGIPLFLEQLVAALRSGRATAELDTSAGPHGLDLLAQGFSISQVVHDYGDVCQTITELAVETNSPISADAFRTLNRTLDEAIAAAVTTYERESQLQASSRQHEASERGNERVGFLVHELRNLVNTAAGSGSAWHSAAGVSQRTAGVSMPEICRANAACLPWTLPRAIAVAPASV